MWFAWRYDGSRWYRCPNPARSDGAFEDMGACQRHANTVGDAEGVPNTWLALTGGTYPQWIPGPRKRRAGRGQGDEGLEDA